MDPDSSIEVDHESSNFRNDLSSTITEVAYSNENVSGLQQILKRPDTYIGSTARTSQKMWVFNKETKELENRKITYVPGIYKIFDDILMNAVDCKKANENSNYIKVMIDKAKGEISVESDGQGIPVQIHTEGIYLPEIIIGRLQSFSDLDNNEQRTYRDIKSYRFIICNVFSRDFTIEIHDEKNSKQYKQTWSGNMSKSTRPEITSGTTSDMTRVTFQPDFSRFHMPNGIDDDLECLLYRRVYDIAGTVPGVEVFLKNERIDIDFRTYCEMHVKGITSKRSAREGLLSPYKIILEDNKSHKEWQIAVAPSDSSFQQVSFVNSVATTAGGTHVKYITDQITTHLFKTLQTEDKTHISGQAIIKTQLLIFINCRIHNPTFSSHDKAELTTNIRRLESKCFLSNGFLDEIAASKILRNAVDFGKAIQEKPTCAEVRRWHISNSKLVDAHLAGTERSHECSLILADGDSVNGLAMCGRALLDPDRLGILPLARNLPNVRNLSKSLISKNEEVQALKEALGLENHKSYSDTRGLRMAGKNLTRPHKRESFFSIPHFEEWKVAHTSEMSLWNHKHFDGLGASSNEDAIFYFTDLDAYLKKFEVMRPDEAQLVELVFSKKKADVRKEWLGSYTPGGYVDRTKSSISFGDFIRNELMLSIMDRNIRSIPSVLDGLTPRQRKILFAAFKKGLTTEQRIIELAGYVSEQTEYDENENSLYETIIGLAQTFAGWNNVNFLEPCGNFGSRLAGGSDAASPRYLSTRLSVWTLKIFSALDEPSPKRCDELGKEAEPEVYAPVIPMILVNGADGVGTGWSTSIPNYNPVEIVQNLKRRMGRLGEVDGEEAEFQPMQPWYRFWNGLIKPAGPNKFETNGTLRWDGGSEVVITELPIGMWTDDFRARLEEMISGSNGTPMIKLYEEFGDHKTVHFKIQLHETIAMNLNRQDLLGLFKLNKQVKTSNLVAFNKAGQLQKYQTVEEILEEYYTFRLEMYTKRKLHWLSKYKMKHRKLQNQTRFIQEIRGGEFVSQARNKQTIIDQLRERNYEPFSPFRDRSEPRIIDDKLETLRQQDPNENTLNFDYLLSMPIWSFTQERLDELKTMIKENQAEHDALGILSEKDMWCQDLDDFLVEWNSQSIEYLETGRLSRRIDN